MTSYLQHRADTKQRSSMLSILQGLHSSNCIDLPDLHCWELMQGSLKTNFPAPLLLVNGAEVLAPKATANRWQELLH